MELITDEQLYGKELHDASSFAKASEDFCPYGGFICSAWVDGDCMAGQCLFIGASTEAITNE